MSDLISRSALLRCLQAELDAAKGVPNKAYAKAILDMLIDVKLAPVVDAEPVRHGRWVNKTERIYADLNYRVDCSACNHIFYAAGIETFKHCPNCGAKMDVEVKHE